MFDSVSNLIFLLIPLAIFIGRIVVEARSKRSGGGGTTAAKPAAPRIPVHFEDDEPAYFKKKTSTQSSTTASKRTQAAKKPKTASAPYTSPLEAASPPASASAGSRVPAKNAARAVSLEQQGFPLTLAKLSPLKQAVVMAEVLGPPKGMQD